MAKKSFSAGVTKTGVLDNAGGAKIKEIQAKAQYNFQYIAKEKIQSNPKNEKYTQDGIESLMESILINGLRHNLSVLYDADQDKYRLISGERRYRAICMMNDKDYNTLFPMGIPCKIEKANIDDIDEEIMLISANHDVRETSMEVKRWEVSRLKELYEAKNKAEKARAKLETNIEKIRQQQKEKEERKISITDNELKKITSLAKAEQALNLFENNFDTLKANKAVIKGDANLKVRVEILRNRFNDFIDSLD